MKPAARWSLLSGRTADSRLRGGATYLASSPAPLCAVRLSAG